MNTTHRLEPGKDTRLSEITTRGKELHSDRAAADEEFLGLRAELIEWQRRLYADGGHKLLIVFQAMDAGGKDGTIGKVFRGVNPQGVRVSSFKTPSTEELAHDYLWRIHKAVPAKRMIGVFNRSHYEDVLVVRVENLLPKAEWRKRYDHINEFEKMLSDTGTTMLKFYLHISRKEQKKRFQARLDDPLKHWKFSIDDLRKREHWDDYRAAYEEMLNRCTTPWAPWYVIPADQKWYRNLAIARVLVDTMKKLNPQFPPAEEGIERIVIE